MKKSKIYTYFVIFSFICIGLITSAMFPALAIIERTKEYYSDIDMFFNTMGPFTNYLSYSRIMVFYVLAFVFCLNYLFFTDKPSFLIRLQSRTEYVKKHLADILIFTSVFVLLLEVVNIVFSFAVFGTEITIKSGLLPFSALDFVTEFLFYMRVGLVLFISGILVNKKYSPFVTFGIYFAEYFLSDYLIFKQDLWLPYTESVVVKSLLTGDISPIGVIPIVIRGAIMNMGLLILAHYLFKKKDIINNEKK